MASRVHFEQNNPDVRHTFRAENVDFVGYKSWKASSEREVRQKGFLGFESWNRAGGSADFTAIFVLGDGTQLTPNPPRHPEAGYQSEEEWIGFGFASDPAANFVEGLTVNYTFEGAPFTLQEGETGSLMWARSWSWSQSC
jgi:hypothetical protein